MVLAAIQKVLPLLVAVDFVFEVSSRYGVSRDPEGFAFSSAYICGCLSPFITG